MPIFKRQVLAAVSVLLGAALLPAAAGAGGFQIRTQSAEGLGAGLSGVAAGESLSFSYWNPAALAGVRRVEAESVGNVILPSFPIRPSAQTNALVAGAGGTATPEIDIAMDAIVPAAYAAAPLTDRLTLGVAVTSPFGLATKSPNDWSGQIYSRTSKILSLNVTPMAAYRVSESFSIGGGVMVQHFSATLSQAAGLGPHAPSVTLSGDSIDIGVTLGAQLALGPATRIGIGYRSAIGHGLGGELDFAGMATPVAVDLTTPETVTAGLRHEVRPGTLLLAGIEWTNWSRLSAIDVMPAGGGPALATLNLNYRDGWLFSAGLEHAVSSTLRARGGYGYEIAPLTDANRDTRLPEVDQHIFSAGLSYAIGTRISLDAAYTHSRAAGDGPIDILPGDPRYLGLPFSARSGLNVNILSLGIKIGFSG